MPSKACPIENRKYHQEYYQKNKERILESQKKYAERNADLIKQRRKEARDAHPDEVAIIKKDYYYNNRAKINAPHECNICGGHYTSKHISQHKKTKKHINALAVLEAVLEENNDN